ncbi:MAG: RHS repeat-associated core domain-containing protein [Thermoleophilia bacterium]
MTDSAGSVVARYAYDPYGRCTAATGEEIATRNPLRYRAYYADAETGLFYLPARYYDPATYRFLSQDPAAPSAGDPLSLNAYAYCSGNPVSFVDSTGATMEIYDNGRLDAEESREQNKQSKKTKTSSDPAGIGAAAASTVFGVLDWTAKNRAAYMTKQMWALYFKYLSAYGQSGPPRYGWADYSQKAKDLVRAKLLSGPDPATAARWAAGRLNQGGYHDWRDDIPIQRKLEGEAVSAVGGTASWGFVFICLGIETAPAGVGIALMAIGAALIAVDYAVLRPAVTDWVEEPYRPY